MNSRRLLAFVHDVLAAAIAWVAAYLLRFNFDVPPNYIEALKWNAVPVVFLNALAFYWFGLYRGVWRFASLPDLRRIVVAVASGALATSMFFLLWQPTPQVPRSVLVLSPLLLLLFLAGSRILYRAWKEGHFTSLRSLEGQNVIVLGGGQAAEQLVRALATSREWRVIGLLDDSVRRRDALIQGVPVLGAIAELAEHAQRYDVSHAIVAMPSATIAQRRLAVKLASEAGLSVLTVPSTDDLVSGKVRISHMRRVDVEDLLGREPVKLDDAAIARYIAGKTAIVTGAGGSIGSELCRQIARYSPAKIVFFEISEFALYTIEQEFRTQHPSIPIVCIAGDVRDEARVRAVLFKHRPDVVFHAAAYKHVPLMEAENAWEAVRNNVYGTLVVAEAAIAANVAKFVFISTDKAVNPTSVMGASKRLAEMVCQALQADASTRFMMVRFGNVLGSTGSVIPLFRRQIAAGGPVTVTHPEVRRYFMSIPEACQLVLQAGAMGEGGEIFVLDMGEPVRILDLARDMIRLSGFSEDDIKIEITGLRPGEKLFEELLMDDESTLPTMHEKLRVAKARVVDQGRWLGELRAWTGRRAPLDEAAVRLELGNWVEEYQTIQKPNDPAVTLERHATQVP